MNIVHDTGIEGARRARGTVVVIDVLRAIATAWIGADITVAAGLQLDVATISILRDAGRGRVIALWNAT